MNKSLPNLIGYGVIILVLLLPIFGYVTYTFLDKPPQPFFNYLAIGLIALIIFERGGLVVHSYIIYYGLFLLYTVVQDVFIVGSDFNIEYVRNNRIIGSFLLALIIDNLMVRKEFKQILINIIYVVVAITFGVILIQELIDNSFLVLPGFNTESLGTNTDRLVAIYSWVDNRMAFGVVFLPMLAIIMGEAAPGNKVVFYWLLFIGLIISFLNRSRITLVQFFILFLYIPIFQGFSFNVFFKYTIVALGSIMIMFVSLKAININVDEIVNERILEKNRNGLEHSSAGTRLLAFKIFGELFPKNPIFGKGKFFRSGEKDDIELKKVLGGRSYQIHVGYLSLLYYYGIIGGLLFILFLISLSRRLYKIAKQTKMWAPFLCWIMFMLNNLTDVMFHFDFMGILIVLVFGNYYYLNKSNDQESINPVVS